MEEAKLTEVLLIIFSTLGVLFLTRVLVAAALEFMASRKRRDEEEIPYKLERPDGYPPLNLAVPENPYPNRKRPYVKRSNYWINPTKRRRKKYTKQSEYWTNGKALEKAKKARAAKLKEKTLN